MDNQEIFKRYMQIADVLGQMFPNILEIAIHDFKDLDHSLIHIVGGHISGRTVGAPVSELNMRRLIEQDDFPDALINYMSRNFRGQTLKSSSLAIRDENGQVIGAFCMHFDLSQFEQFHKFLEFFLHTTPDPFVGLNDFGQSQPFSEEIHEEIKNWRLVNGLFSAPLTYKDKQAIVEHLSLRGFFKKKGAIPCIAQALQLTRQSIYNYLENLKCKNQEPS